MKNMMGAGPAGPKLDHGYRSITLRARGASGVFSVRSLTVCAVLAIVTVALFVTALGLGTIWLPANEVLAALVGVGDEQSQLLVLGWRMPRALFAIFCGVALALSGAVFQSLTRNPLGSPDIIGFASGSYTGAIVVMLAIGSTKYLDVAAGSLVGGCVTAALVYFLATKNGTAGAFRLIIMGIGVGAMLNAVNSALMMFVDVDSAMLAAVWAAGSLNGLGYEQLWPMCLILLVFVVVLIVLARRIALLEFGDDSAQMLGVRTRWVRAIAVVTGVALTALVTASAGPIAFVALAAPQIAVRLVRGSGMPLVASALVGAFLLLGADIIAQAVGFPVGVITASLGGAYLIWLLASEFRKRRTV